jgi:hypothetical protein
VKAAVFVYGLAVKYSLLHICMAWAYLAKAKEQAAI